MSFDAHGLLWISDPTTATLAIGVLTALLLTCHRRLLAEAVPIPVRSDDAVLSRRRSDDAGCRTMV